MEFLSNKEAIPNHSPNHYLLQLRFGFYKFLRQQQPSSRTSVVSTQDIVYSENFDAGAPAWTFQDLWSESFWHVSATGAYSGNSYWCGIEELGGYDDKWLQTLTSPAIDLSEAISPTLTFMEKQRSQGIYRPHARPPAR